MGRRSSVLCVCVCRARFAQFFCAGFLRSFFVCSFLRSFFAHSLRRLFPACCIQIFLLFRRLVSMSRSVALCVGFDNTFLFLQ